MRINPPCKKFVVFSGGGGLISRSQVVDVPAGRTSFEISDVPASFDPNTTMVELLDVTGDVALAQIDVKRPDKRIMDNFITREKTASDNIISASTDLRGSSREKIIQICESAYYRRYEDMLGSISVLLEAKAPSTFTLRVRYFIEDTRIKWRPTVHVNIDPKTHQATLEGYIMIMNNSDFSFENVEVEFAEFELTADVTEEGFFEDLATEQAVQNKMPSTNLLKRMKKSRLLAM